MNIRHGVLALFAMLCLSTATAQVSAVGAVAPDEFRVTLLGTGSPAPVMRRFGPGVLVRLWVLYGDMHCSI